MRTSPVAAVSTLALCSLRAADRRELLELRVALASEVQLQDGKAPEWVQLFPAGPKLQTLDGRAFTLADPKAVVARRAAHPLQLPVDLEHSTHLKGPKGEPAPAYAWIGELAAREDHSIWGRVAWTEEGRRLVEGGQYRYISPGFRRDANGVIHEVISAGLTNKPAFVMAALASEGAEGDTSMNPCPKEICEALGLPLDCTVEQAVAAIKALKEKSATETARTISLDKFVPRQDYDTVLARATTAEGKLAAQAKEQLETEIARVVDEARVAGKITPATRDFYLEVCRAPGGLEKFKAFAAAAPVVTAPSGLDGKAPPAASVGSELSAQEIEVCRNLGITQDDYRKARA